MVGGVLLLLDKVTHEVPQQLRARAFAFPGNHRELPLQPIVDSESEARFAHPADLMSYTMGAL